MAQENTAAIDPATAAAARAGAVQPTKAEKERARRETIKRAKEAVAKAGLPADTKLDLDQRKRAADAAEKKAGLSGKALATWILEGKTTGEQVQEARAERSKAERAERQRSNLTRSTDPEAAELAQAAKALAPDVKSSFLPKEGRQFLDELLPRGGGAGAAGLLSRVVATEEGEETVTITQAALRRHSVENEKDQEVRAHLTALGKGTKLWGRKLGLFILAKIDQEKKAAKAAA